MKISCGRPENHFVSARLSSKLLNRLLLDDSFLFYLDLSGRGHSEKKFAVVCEGL